MANNTAVYSITKLFVMSGSFTEIPGITSISGPSISRGEIEVSNMNSVGFRDYKASALADPGTLSFTCQFNPSNTLHKMLLNRVATGSVIDTWQLTFSDNTSYQFSGSMQDFSVKADNPADGILMGDAKIRVTGAVILPA